MSGKLDRRTCGAYAIRPYSLPAGVVVPNGSSICRCPGRGVWHTPLRTTPQGAYDQAVGNVYDHPQIRSAHMWNVSHSPTPSHLQTGRLCHSPTPLRPQTAHVFHSPSPSDSQTGRLCHSSGPSDSQTGPVWHSPEPSGSHFACKSASPTLKVYDVQRRCDSRALETYYMRCR